MKVKLSSRLVDFIGNTVITYISQKLWTKLDKQLPARQLDSYCYCLFPVP